MNNTDSSMILGGAQGAAQGASMGGAAGGIIGGIAGIGMGLINANKAEEDMDKNKELMDYQYELNQKGVENQYNLQKNMYDYTYSKNTYQAQKRQMELAGLNPGLLYGKSGGSGMQATTGSTGAASAALSSNFANSAQKQQANTQQLAMGLSLSKLKAEIDNMNADTKQKLTNATKTETVDTELTKNTIDNIIAQTANENSKNNLIRIQTDLTEAQTEIANVEAEYAKEVTERTIDEMKGSIRRLNADASLSEETKNLIKDKIKSETYDNYMSAALKGSSIELNSVMKKKLSNDIKIAWEQVSQGWNNLTQTEKSNYIKAFEAETRRNMPTVGNVIGRQLKRAIDDGFYILEKIGNDINSGTYSPKPEKVPGTGKSF